MPKFAPALPHSLIEEVFPEIFFVTGTSIFRYNGMDIQKSNNMVIVRNGTELTLINTLRLNKEGLDELNSLGRVAHIVRIGAFHDRNDPFYLDCYPDAKLWALKGMQHNASLKADVELEINGRALPFPHSSIFIFKTATQPEGVILIDREGGILVTCDSIKNWIESDYDPYFSTDTRKDFLEKRLIAPANIDHVWMGAMKPSHDELKKIAALQFKHLLSAHGQPLRDTAHEAVAATLKRNFGLESSLE